MPDVMRLAVVLLGLVLAITTTALVSSARRHTDAIAVEAGRLIKSAAPGTFPAHREILRDLPPPVARYLQRALPVGRPLRAVRLSQTGVLRTAVDSGRWLAFEAEHLAVADPPGFLWNARVAIAPLLHVRVRDALIDGSGSGSVTFLTAIPVAGDAGTAEIDAGSLHRYLAEAVWYPTALLPTANLQWTAIDDRRAQATIRDGGSTVALEFRFDDDGLVSAIYTPARWGRFDDGYRQMPWEGFFRHYESRNGVLVPTEGEVGWHVGGVWESVWKGRVVSYDVNPRR